MNKQNNVSSKTDCSQVNPKLEPKFLNELEDLKNIFAKKQDWCTLVDDHRTALAADTVVANPWNFSNF